jgi:hypothetical protein
MVCPFYSGLNLLLYIMCMENVICAVKRGGNEMKICLYGAARNQIDESYIKAAEAFGYSLARRGHVLVFGGGARGMMGAAARGTAAGNGNIVAVAPADMNIDEEEFGKCTHFLYTKTLAERKTRFIELADAFVVMPGGIGTYDEFFDLLSIKRLNEWTSGEGVPISESDDGDVLLRASVVHTSMKPVAVYNINGYYSLLEEFLEQTISQGFAGEWTRDLYRFCSTEEEVWQCLEGFPEECCDAAELSDNEYESWEKGAKNGFWNDFLKNNK